MRDAEDNSRAGRDGESRYGILETIPAFSNRRNLPRPWDCRRLGCETTPTAPERVQGPRCDAESRLGSVEEARGAWGRGRARRLDGCVDVGRGVQRVLGRVCRDELL